MMLAEYAAWVAIDLSFQRFDDEVSALPGDYAPPAGALLIARLDAAAAGMVAMRKRGDDGCEMKRLFVRESARGAGVGWALIQRVVKEARARRYRLMVLDTLPMMRGAQRLYERAGFIDVPPYYRSPVAGTRFLALDLESDTAGGPSSGRVP